MRSPKVSSHGPPQRAASRHRRPAQSSALTSPCRTGSASSSALTSRPLHRKQRRKQYRKQPRQRQLRDQPMADISAADIKKLRELTGAGMMDCRNALVEADGDFDKAVEILRVKGAGKVQKRGAERTASNGLVAAAEGAMIELLCETDFVAKNEQFQQLAADIVAHAAAAKPADSGALL